MQPDCVGWPEMDRDFKFSMFILEGPVVKRLRGGSKVILI